VWQITKGEALRFAVKIFVGGASALAEVDHPECQLRASLRPQILTAPTPQLVSKNDRTWHAHILRFDEMDLLPYRFSSSVLSDAVTKSALNIATLGTRILRQVGW
jgi:hypothetical protein